MRPRVHAQYKQYQDPLVVERLQSAASGLKLHGESSMQGLIMNFDWIFKELVLSHQRFKLKRGGKSQIVPNAKTRLVAL